MIPFLVVDRLPLLLKIWSPGTFSKDYVEDVVTLVHVSDFRRSDTRDLPDIFTLVSWSSKLWITEEQSKYSQDAARWNEVKPKRMKGIMKNRTRKNLNGARNFL